MGPYTLAVICGIIAISNASVIQTQAAHLTGEIVQNADSTVTLQVTLIGGSPSANSITWTLPDGSKIGSGGKSEGFETSVTGKSNPQDGASFTYSLHMLNGYTSSVQRVEFRAEYTGVPGWWRTYSFTLSALSPAFTSNTPVVSDVIIGTIRGEQTDNADGTYTLTATVSGGSPAVESVRWELEDGTHLLTGHSDSQYSTAAGSNTPGVVHYILILKGGLTSNSQSITFRATGADSRWWATHIFNLPSKLQAIVQEPGSITGDAVYDRATKTTTITAKVQGGHPAPNTYKWTVQQPDGTYADLSPGEKGTYQRAASMVTVNGQPTLTLTVTGTSARWRSVKLYVTSEDASSGFLNWWANRSWWATPSA